MDQAPVYLALDFDGVLHHGLAAPFRKLCVALEREEITSAKFIDSANASLDDDPCVGRLFRAAGLLTQALDQSNRLIHIVVATSWRNSMSVPTICSVLPAGLANRVVGSLARAEEHDASGRYLTGIRGTLMHDWLNHNAAAGADWLAVDDVQELWAHHTCHLFPTRWPGIDAKSAQSLESRLVGL